MALRDNEQQYYYFKMRSGRPYEIKVTAVHINLLINLIYQEMTAEQQAFYIEHPDATVMEVWNCELVPPYVPPTQDVAEYAAQKVKELKDVCYFSVTVTTLEFAMAIDKVENPTASCYYGLADAQRVVSDFRTQSKKAMTVYVTYKPRIEAASSVEAIDEVYNQAMEAL